MFFGHLIYYRRCLLRFDSFCRAAYLHRQACLGHSDRDFYPPSIDWGIELVLISSDPPIKTQLMITLRSGKVPMGTPPKRATSSFWWPRLEGLRRIATTDIPPSGDQKRPMLEHPMME
jgi:hypothetical protein